MALTKERKNAIVEEFARSKGDTGSVEVQVALLTERINILTEHMKEQLVLQRFLCLLCF